MRSWPSMSPTGWPTVSAVGEEAATAAWAIAQHADLDPAFQQRALDLLEQAVAEGEGSPGDLAYLTDRVATNTGAPQLYGTQIRCGPDGPQPAVPIADESQVDALRAEAGLPPLAAYLDEMAAICADPELVRRENLSSSKRCASLGFERLLLK